LLPAAAVAVVILVLALENGAYGVVDRGILAVGVWWAIALCAALRLWPRQPPPPAALLAGGFLALLAGLTALSITWADSAEKAFAEVDRLLLYLGVFTLVVMATRRGDATRWSNGLAIGITAVGVLGLVSELFPDFIGPGAPPSFFASENRLSWPLNYWNGLGIFVGLGFPLLLRIATARGAAVLRALSLAPIPALTAAIYLTSSRGAAATAAFGVLVFMLLTGRRMAAAVAFVISAAGAAAAVALLVGKHALVDGPAGSSQAADQAHSAAILLGALGIAVAVAYWLWIDFGEQRVGAELGRRGTTALLGAGAVVLLAGAVAVHPIQKFNDFRQSPAEQRISESDFTKAHLLSANGSGRWQIWESAVDQFAEHPVAGEGAGSFESWWAQHGTLRKFLRDAHSLYLETMGELGVLGLVVLLGMFGSGFVAAIRRLMRLGGSDRTTVAALTAVLAGFALAAAIDWMWELTVVAVVALVTLGLLTGPATFPRSRSGTDAQPPGRPARRRATAVRAGIVAVAVMAICVEGVLLLSQGRLEDSRAAAERGDIAEARAAALDAKSIEPWAASPYLQLALLDEQSGNLGAARGRIRQAIDREARDWRLWLVSARIAVKAGFIPQAKRDLARAKSLNPRSPLFAQKNEASR
jgi:hypothetical protein